MRQSPTHTHRVIPPLAGSSLKGPHKPQQGSPSAVQAGRSMEPARGYDGDTPVLSATVPPRGQGASATVINDDTRGVLMHTMHSPGGSSEDGNTARLRHPVVTCREMVHDRAASRQHPAPVEEPSSKERALLVLNLQTLGRIQPDDKLWINPDRTLQIHKCTLWRSAVRTYLEQDGDSTVRAANDAVQYGVKYLRAVMVERPWSVLTDDIYRYLVFAEQGLVNLHAVYLTFRSRTIAPIISRLVRCISNAISEVHKYMERASMQYESSRIPVDIVSEGNYPPVSSAPQGPAFAGASLPPSVD